MKTFLQICTDLQRILHKYICYCNKEDNLKLVRETVVAYLIDEDRHGNITDYGVKCDKSLNPADWNGNPQRIQLEFGVMMPDNTNPQAMLVIGTQQVSAYVKYDPINGANFTQSGPTDAVVEQDEHPDDAYERAMRGI